MTDYTSMSLTTLEDDGAPIETSAFEDECEELLVNIRVAEDNVCFPARRWEDVKEAMDACIGYMELKGQYSGK